MTAQASPVTIFNELHDDLYQTFMSGRMVVEFQCRQYEARIAKLKSVDIAGYYECEALLKVIKGNIAQSEEAYAHARRLTDDPFGTFLRHLSLQGLTHRYMEQLENYRAYRDKLRSSPGEWARALEMLTVGGWILTADKDRDALTEQAPHVLPKAQGPTYTLDMRGFSEESVAEAVSWATVWLREKQARVDGSFVSSFPGAHGAESLLVQIKVRLEPERCAEMEWDFFAALGEKAFPVEVAGVVAFALVPTA